MALPYLVLSAFPSLVAKMPKAGPASLLIKQIMGILMLSAAAYFIGTGLHSFFADPLQPSPPNYFWAVGGIIAVAGFWLTYKTFRITTRASKRLIFGALGLLLILSGWALADTFTQKPPIDWVPYTQERFKEAKAEGKIIVIDFTAEWCINCKTLEHTVLAADSIVKALDHDSVVPMKVDLTGHNPEGKELLKKVGRVAIPLLLIYDRESKEIFKQDFYTTSQLEQIFQELGVPLTAE